MAWKQISETVLLFFLIHNIDPFFKGNFQQRVHKEANYENAVHSAWQ